MCPDQGSNPHSSKRFVLPYFAVYNAHPRFWRKLSGEKKPFHFNFLIQLFIYLYLDTCFLYYKGILAFIFEHTDILIAF